MMVREARGYSKRISIWVVSQKFPIRDRSFFILSAALLSNERRIRNENSEKDPEQLKTGR